jgi:hypothetical protein
MRSAEVGGDVHKESGLKLLAVCAIVDPFARRCDPLTGGNSRRMTDNSHDIPMSPRHGPQDAKAVLHIVVRDALDEACKDFLRRYLGRVFITSS